MSIFHTYRKSHTKFSTIGSSTIVIQIVVQLYLISLMPHTIGIAQVHVYLIRVSKFIPPSKIAAHRIEAMPVASIVGLVYYANLAIFLLYF